MHIAFAVRHSAASVSDKRDDRFAGEAARREEGQDRGRHRAPPVRCADEDDIVFGEIRRHGFEFRFDTCADLFLRLGDTFVVVGGVRLDGDDLKERSAGRLLDFLRRETGVSAVGVVGDENFRGFRGCVFHCDVVCGASACCEHCGRHCDNVEFCFHDCIPFILLIRWSRQSIRL